MKRIVLATLFGLCMGVLCASGAFYGHLLKFTAINLAWILLNRAVMGFVIGISAVKLHWAWNGVVMGMAVGSIFSYFLFMTLGPGVVPIANFFVNGIFGVIIEFFTSVVCKQRAHVTPAPMLRAVAA